VLCAFVILNKDYLLTYLLTNLWATATLTASSDSLSPTAVIGGACSQSPECWEAAARSLALSTSAGALVRIRSFWFAATGPSQTFWVCYVCWEGFGELARSVYNVSVDVADWSPCIQMLSGSIDCRRQSVDAGVAKWAEGASISALRIPRPPLGRVMKLMEPLIIVDVYI